MNRMLLALLVTPLAGTLLAQESTNAIPRNDAALRAAAAALAKVTRETARQKQYRLAGPPAPGKCSVPLLTMQIDKNRSFTARTVPAPPVEPMPLAQVPAPPCPR